MHVLVLSTALPYPPIGGGRLRSYHLLKGLAERHTVTQIGFTFGPIEAANFPIEVIPVPWEQPELYQQMYSADSAISQRAHVELLTRSPEPWFVSYYDCPRMTETIARTNARHFDLVIFEGTPMGRFLPQLPASTPALLNLNDLHSLMARRQIGGKTGADWQLAQHEFDRTLRFEGDLARHCVATLTCSSQEAVAARQLLGVDRIHVVPNGVDRTHFAPTPQIPHPGSLLFTGMMNYEPNIRAVQHFVRAILPRLPGTTFHIVGANAGPEVRQLASDRVKVHDYVPDVRPYLAAAEVVVVPLLDGGGTRLKILEAAASGKPIVTTSQGAEGLDFVTGRDLLRADTVDDFVTAVADLLRNPDQRRQLGANAVRAAAAYDWRRIGVEFSQIVESAATIAA